MTAPFSITALLLLAMHNQDELNKRQHPQWMKSEQDYGFAMAKECMELADHTNWNWYGKHSDRFNTPLTDDQKLDIQIELSDILHFGLSLGLIAAHSGEEETVPLFGSDRTEAVAHNLAVSIFKTREYRTLHYRKMEPGVAMQVDLRKSAMTLAEFGMSGQFNAEIFAQMCRIVDLSPVALMALYFGKTELNKFRWSNGYGDGSYMKMWPGEPDGSKREDNIYMARTVLHGIGNDAVDQAVLQSIANGQFSSNVQAKLQNMYAAFKTPDHHSV